MIRKINLFKVKVFFTTYKSPLSVVSAIMFSVSQINQMGIATPSKHQPHLYTASYNSLEGFISAIGRDLATSYFTISPSCSTWAWLKNVAQGEVTEWQVLQMVILTCLCVIFPKYSSPEMQRQILSSKNEQRGKGWVSFLGRCVEISEGHGQKGFVSKVVIGNKMVRKCVDMCDKKHAGPITFE